MAVGSYLDGVKYEERSPKQEEMEDGYEEEPITADDYWTVINSFFGDQGLARQQLDSFNEFIENSMQEIVDERNKLVLDQFTQYTGAAGDETVSFSIPSIRLAIDRAASA